MCETCPAHILGPGEVAGKVARSKAGRRVMFWGFAVPMLPFAIWGELHWWTLVLVALAAVVAVGTYQGVRILHRGVVMAAPTPAQRVAELERRRRNAIPIPAARPALPRGLSITRKRQCALPVAAKALPAAVVTGKVVPAPAERAAR